tara:strand:- start:335 stop:667 length:333 start_codon:yes stop_codon:yes gene_type:complete
MAAGKYNIRIDQGSDFSIQLTVKESGSAKNITGYSARAQLRSSITSSSITATFTCTITNAANGILTMALPAATTTNITPGNYVYDLEIVTGSAVQRLIEGTATVRAEVTR